MSGPTPDPVGLLVAWIETLDIEPGATVLVVDPPSADAALDVAAAVASEDLTARCVFVCTHYGTARDCQAAGLTAEHAVASGAEHTAGIVFLPKGRERAALLFEQTAGRLPAGAPMWVVGPKRGGIGSAAKTLAPFASVERTESGRHCKLLFASANGTAARPLEGVATHWRLEVADWSTEVSSLPGVFHHGELDEGTALLLDVLASEPAWGPGVAVADVGCGAGVIGAWLASRGCDTVLTDVDALALWSARATLGDCGGARVRARVVAADVLENVEESFDAIVSNPPFHTGFDTDHAIAERLVAQAHRKLRPGGTLTLVLNRHLKTPERVAEVFGSFDVLAANRRFHVVRATRR